METKKLMCHYARYKCRADILMLNEFVEYCDQEASQVIILPSMPSIKRKICQRSECWEKAAADLNIKKQERKQKKETAKKLKKIRSAGLSDAEIWRRWEELN